MTKDSEGCTPRNAPVSRNPKPYVHCSPDANLTIPEDVNAYSFWPWRSSQITNLFHSCPPGEYSLEAWDVYCEGAFRYTEYYIHVK